MALRADTRVPGQAFAGIVTVSVGHCHPRVVAAIDAQNHRLQHTTSIYLNNQIAEYAQELTARLPGDLKARPKTIRISVAADLLVLSAFLALVGLLEQSPVLMLEPRVLLVACTILGPCRRAAGFLLAYRNQPVSGALAATMTRKAAGAVDGVFGGFLPNHLFHYNLKTPRAGGLLCEQRQRGQRRGAAHGAPVQRQLRPHRAAQLLPWHERCHHGHDQPPHLEVPGAPGAPHTFQRPCGLRVFACSPCQRRECGHVCSRRKVGRPLLCAM